MYQSTKCGDLATLQELDASGYIFDSLSISIAATNGHFHIVRWLLEKGVKYDICSLLYWASFYGNLEMFQWLHNNGYKIKPNIMDDVVNFGYLDIVKWLHLNGYRSDNAMNIAAGAGQLEVVQWLHLVGYKCDIYAMDTAAKNGYLKMVEYLISIDKPCSMNLIDYAVKNKQLDVIRVVLDNGLKCDENIFLHAERLGLLDLIRELSQDEPNVDNINKELGKLFNQRY